MTDTPRTRSPLVYRLALALPVTVFAGLYLSGRWAALRMYPAPGQVMDEAEFFQGFITSIIWVLGLVPLIYLAWELGRQHTGARRLHNELFIGFRELLVVAVRGRPSTDIAREFSRVPDDNPWAAAAWGLGVAILVPAFFASATPLLRTPNALVWLVVTGLLFGVMMYCQRRSAAYLIDEPKGILFRQWALLNPTRYAPKGRPFVRCMIAATLVLPLWWLGGAAWVFSP